jgi:hypothetical protein
LGEYRVQHQPEEYARVEAAQKHSSGGLGLLARMTKGAASLLRELQPREDLGLEMRDLWPSTNGQGERRIVATYDYTDERG